MELKPRGVIRPGFARAADPVPQLYRDRTEKSRGVIRPTFAIILIIELKRTPRAPRGPVKNLTMEESRGVGGGLCCGVLF